MPQATFSVNSSSWATYNSSVQFQLTSSSAPVRCGNLFSFHAYFASISSSSNLNKCMVIITVEEVLSTSSNPFRASLKVEYKQQDRYGEYVTSGGAWPEQCAIVTPPISTSLIMSFALPMPNDISANQHLMPTKVTLSLEPALDLGCTTGRPTPTVFQKARYEAMLDTINDPNLCDVSLLPRDAGDAPILVSRAILAHASPYFKTMFMGDWAESKDINKPMTFEWSVSSVIPCLLHMYSGWVLDEPLPACQALKTLMDVHEVDPAEFSLHELLELVDLADMLELPMMVHATYQVMARKLQGKVTASARVAKKLNRRTNPVKSIVDSAVEE